MSERQLDRVAKASKKVEDAERRLGDARGELRATIRDARKAGVSMTRIGKAAGGITRQRVKQLLD